MIATIDHSIVLKQNPYHTARRNRTAKRNNWDNDKTINIMPLDYGRRGMDSRQYTLNTKHFILKKIFNRIRVDYYNYKHDKY